MVQTTQRRLAGNGTSMAPNKCSRFAYYLHKTSKKILSRKPDHSTQDWSYIQKSLSLQGWFVQIRSQQMFRTVMHTTSHNTAKHDNLTNKIITSTLNTLQHFKVSFSWNIYTGELITKLPTNDFILPLLFIIAEFGYQFVLHKSNICTPYFFIMFALIHNNAIACL